MAAGAKDVRAQGRWPETARHWEIFQHWSSSRISPIMAPASVLASLCAALTVLETVALLDDAPARVNEQKEGWNNRQAILNASFRSTSNWHGSRVEHLGWGAVRWLCFLLSAEKNSNESTLSYALMAQPDLLERM